MPISRIARSIEAVASLRDLPGARLKEIVLGDERPLMVHRQRAYGLVRKWAKAASGIIVSLLVLTAAADDAMPLPVFASALVEALRAELAAMVAAVVASAVLEVATVPTTAFDVRRPRPVRPTC